MASVKEIRDKISSVKSTQKITKAMEMVAASKMRRSQDVMRMTRPYSEAIREVVAHVASAALEDRHIYLEERDVKRVGYIIVSTDRGLCGGLNINLFKKAVCDMQVRSKDSIEIQLAVIGLKAIDFFSKNSSIQIIAQVSGIGDTPLLKDLIGTIGVMLQKYGKSELDRLFVVYNRFVNTMLQEAVIEQLLPFPKLESKKMENAYSWDYIYEPKSKVLLDALLMRYLESRVYQGVVENLACEQAARMVAMKSASDNASNLIEDLELVHNKARQAIITQELSEIVSGAEAV
ncbi:ATP synthase gamma chain [Candidatus Photodesmus blepharus]|uniref:ATP synthase gamma chain n=1 Tax=Candidatus Photodesmus blepharonis TaxID=1179155 RepID=A0A084CNN5_9GAMM|nr:F0F1 ATP synthase subunit gamma [Candidatus Photodesmus blepharus]KEY91414.1 ATP synthase gamma chain [Candidatus Photodesmus blepharus]